MAISAQDKILHVANKLGLSSLKYMQASTGAIYDGNIAASSQHTFFANAVQHQFPAVTNVTDNRFEVNEALLIETIGFYGFPTENNVGTDNLCNANWGANNYVIVFDVVIGNKVVMKEVPVWKVGGPSTFASGSYKYDPIATDVGQQTRHQVYMEGVGILIPPQVEFSVNAQLFDALGNAVSDTLGCYLFGTKVNLNFNTTL